MNPSRRRLSLRARVSFAFGLGTMLLSAVLVVFVYGLTRENLVSQRENTATRQMYVNARVMRDALRTSDIDVPRLLSSLETPAGSRPVLFHQGRWFAQAFARGRDDLPGELRQTVVSGTPAKQRFDLDGGLDLGIGVPIPAVDAAYFEVVPLDDLAETLDSILYSLAAGALLTTVAGALLGGWISVRVLRPLSEVTEAAQALAEGDLATRLEGGGDQELARLAQSFNHMAEALQERIERDERFASDVSHELRSPLTTLSSSLSVLETRRDELSQRGRHALDLLAGDVRRFSQMVEDLLEISRVDTGRASMHLEPVWIAPLVRHAAEMSRDDTAPTITIDEDAEAAVVMGDKRRLIRVVGNLIENARIHGDGRVDVTVEADDVTVTIYVDDEGPGVPPEERALVFERFARGRGANNRAGSEGSGLGLALVAEHTTLHRGHVWVADAPAGGARFAVALPLVDLEELDDDESSPDLAEVTSEHAALGDVP